MKIKTGNFIENLDFYGLRRMFYLLLPGEGVYSTIEETPNYVDEATPWFFLFIIFEIIYDRYTGRKNRLYSINDTITSLTAGLLHITVKLFFRYAEVRILLWTYENYRLIDLAWDSHLTWILALVGTDLSYYWFHRAAHEIRFLWAFHQIHHSSEYFNISTALRQGMFQQYAKSISHLPLALFIPPQVIFAHDALNLCYQLYIHTRVLPKMTPLVEAVLNTPSHHRVHHGSNDYCVDKNYGGFLILWDKLFGTFAPEREEEEPVRYGLVEHTMNTFDALYCQIFYFRLMWPSFRKIPKFADKLKFLFYGPDWSPEDIMNRDELMPETVAELGEPYDVRISPVTQIYIIFHYIFAAYIYSVLAIYGKELDWPQRLPYLIFMFYTAFCFGQFFDAKPTANTFELFRCIYCYLWACRANLIPGFAQTAFHIVSVIQIVIWLFTITFRINVKRSND